MRLLGNFGTTRIGATAGLEYYWNHQWTIKYRAASAKLVKTVTLTEEDLYAFAIKGGCESGSLTLTMQQAGTTKELDLTSTPNGRVDMRGFTPGKLTLVLQAKSAKKIQLQIGWRR